MTAPSATTCLWFDDQAEEAATLYTSLFDDAQILNVTRQVGSDKAFIVEMELLGQRYTMMNGGPHYKLSPAVSIQVYVLTQEEIDTLWSALGEGGEEMRCGWLADRFGLSWQILPKALSKWMSNPKTAPAVGAAFMQMVKFDIATLQKAAESAQV